MKHKKLLLLIPIPFIIAALAVFIRPRETVIDETIRFYNVEQVNYEGYADDTDFGELTNGYVDVKTDLKVVQGVGSSYVEGTMKIGDMVYYTGLMIKGDVTGIMLTMKGEDDNWYSSGPSELHFSDDLKHIELIISQGEAEGIWFNSETLGDYKEAVKELYRVEL